MCSSDLWAASCRRQRASIAEAEARQQAGETKERLVDLWTDRARQLLADDPWRALVYLEAAMKAGRDEPRIRSLIGAAFQAIPPSVRVPGHRFEGAWMGPDPLAGGFLDDQGGVWRVDGDALTPPAFKIGRAHV